MVEACLYPPAGIRGWGPRRAAGFGFDTDEYFRSANESMICIPIIESRDAVDNVEEILSVDGIDGVCVGPLDLSISLGIFRQFEHPTYVSAYEKVRQACHKFKKAMGTGTYSLEHAEQCAAAGDAILLVGGDDVYLSAESRRCLETLRPKKGDPR